jgi:rubredoxin
MDKWQCLLCGYIYDPEEGDPTQGILRHRVRRPAR